MIGFLMFHGGLGICVNARVEDLRFENSNPKMNMQTQRLVLEFPCHVLVRCNMARASNP